MELREQKAFDRAYMGIEINIARELQSFISCNTPNKSFADRVCMILHLDADKLWNMTLDEIPEPKIWKTLNADGSKKTPQKQSSKKKGAKN